MLTRGIRCGGVREMHEGGQKVKKLKNKKIKTPLKVFGRKAKFHSKGMGEIDS